MDKRLFVLRSDEIKREMVIYIANLPIEPLMQVEIKPFVKKRSLEQNSSYWGVYLPAIRQEIIDTSGNDYSIEGLHEYFKDMYLIPKVVEVMGEIKHITKSTTKLNVKEFIAYTGCIQQWCMDKLDGFQLPDLITREYE